MYLTKQSKKVIMYSLLCSKEFLTFLTEVSQIYIKKRFILSYYIIIIFIFIYLDYANIHLNL
jgi:hypothetical protein